MRSLKMALVLAPIMIVGYSIGLHWGPTGVAIGTSISMALWVIPHVAWTVRGTIISLKDILCAVAKPLIASLVATLPSYAVAFGLLSQTLPIIRLGAGLSVFVATYLVVLLFGMRQWPVFHDVLVTLIRGRHSLQAAK